MRIEESILSNLIYSEDYTRQVIPFLKTEYFSDRGESVLLDEITEFFYKHNALPTKEILKIQVTNRTDIRDRELDNLIETIEGYEDLNTHKEWLIEETELFCRKKAVYNSILESIKIIEGNGGTLSEDAIPQLLQEALAVSFDKSVGHSYFDDAGARFDAYSDEDERIPFDLKMMNKVYKRGMPVKSLIVIIAQSGGGKSLAMSHIGAATLAQGKNVLYITMEMAENKIAERVDANLLGVDIDDIIQLGKAEFISRIDKIKNKSQGRLYIKEYPPSSASAAHFRGLLEELKVKQKFVPDLIIIDYLGICASSRLKMGSSVNTNTYMKSVAEELRGLGIEYGVPVLTGGQLNREGFNSSDVDEKNIADSIGVVMTADIAFAMIRTPELDELNQVMIKQLKNRYGDKSRIERFVLGIDRPRMKLYDAEDSAQENISQLTNSIVRPGVPQASEQLAPTRSNSGMAAIQF